jgi:hypothetical protein
MRKITDKDTLPGEALTYEYIFVDKTEIVQDRIKNSNQPRKFSVKITYRMYAIDSNGVKHYKIGANSVRLKNFQDLGKGSGNQNDDDLIDALDALQVAIAGIISAKANLNTEII